MRTLVLWVLLATPTLALADVNAKIGIVVSPTPALAPIAEQFEVGAKLAFTEISETTNFNYELVHLNSDLGSEEAIRTLKDRITAEGITAIIAASTNYSANTLRHQTTGWTTPTVIVTPPDLIASPGLEDRNGYIVDVGPPLQHLQAEVMKHWQDCYARDGLTIVFNRDFTWSEEFAKQAAGTFADRSHIAALGWSDSQDAAFHDEIMEKVARETKGNPDVGIILAGGPWNASRWITSLADSGVEAPIYVGPYVSSLSKLQEFAATSGSTIFAAPQYWTDPDNASQKDFTDAAAEELGWTQKPAMTPIALQAYDAAAVIASAYLAGEITTEGAESHWWGDLMEVQGIKGTLKHHDDVTLSPPTDLLKIERDGTASFIQDFGNCP